VPGNADRGLVDSNALVMLCDAESGYPTGILGGMGITALRTAAGALAGARPFGPKAPRKLALIGCGRIQRFTARFFTSFYPGLEEVAVHARTQAGREAFCVEHGAKFRPCGSAGEAVEGADLIVSCVPQAARPMLEPDMFKPGAVFVPLDVTASWDKDLYEACDLVLGDNLPQFEIAVRDRRGGVDLDLGRVKLMGDVLRGLVEVPAAPRLTMSVVTGTAETDLFVARFILEKAGRDGIGTVIPFG
jgi:ornithine cyclodeaminase/alanine dehydrogenase-like protein (mu-crystallin family)